MTTASPPEVAASGGVPPPAEATGRRLLLLAADLVDIDSVSHHERAVADHVEALLRSSPHLQVARVGETVVARTTGGRPRRLLLAGHLDTVPGTGGASVEGDRLSGLGAVDMKGGLAVLLDLAATCGAPAVDATYVFYDCEEVARRHSGLGRLRTARPDLLDADAAVLLEPTGGVVEAGCQGTMRARVTLSGRRAHTARPWTGTNAVHRLGPVLDLLAGYEPRPVELDGCRYLEQLQAVAVEGGIAGNVVPDSAAVTLNYRFAPDRTPAEAEAALRRLLQAALGPDDRIEVVEAAPAAPPALGAPLLAQLVHVSRQPPRAKVGWTDVATFSEAGLPATNFGPGDPLLAHSGQEVVSAAELAGAHRCLAALLDGPAGEADPPA